MIPLPTDGQEGHSGHPTPATMPCPNGCDHQLATGDTCPHCGHQLTIAQQRHLATRTHGRAAIARTRATWEQWKNDHPRTTTRRSA